MGRGFIVYLCFMLGGLVSYINAQEPLSQDSSRVEKQPELQQVDKKVLAGSDTVEPLIGAEKVVLADSIVVFNKTEFKPNPTRAVLYSAIFPGLGQVYNRKYWKLPIIYGGVLGLTYAITWNGNMYSDYNQAFKDLVTGSGTSYNNFVPRGYDVLENKDRWVDRFRKQKDFFRRNRDLAIIVAVGVYALCMIDAYVDAQLYDFDMSPDLSMRVVPVVMMPSGD